MLKSSAAIILVTSLGAWGDGQPPQPPAEALSACEGSVAGAACRFDAPRGTVAGTCRAIRGEGDTLVCAPDRGAGGQGAGRGGPPRMRQHTVVQSDGQLELLPATEDPIAPNRYESRVDGDWRCIQANAVAEHLTGPFPNRGNPNSIEEQVVVASIPAAPTLEDVGEAKPVTIPGWGLNGVKFDPGAAEFYQGDRSLGWQYEALSGAIALGLDENHAHVQLTGHYHYHGLPTLLMAELGVKAGAHSPQIGWAADGFPIYALYGLSDATDMTSPAATMTSSWRLKEGKRPTDGGQPGGTYDGTFVNDFEYVEGSGDLDECNGRITVTPDFPNGTYAYFLTETYPVVPRCLKGQVTASNWCWQAGGEQF